jgi:hypothetical protein
LNGQTVLTRGGRSEENRPEGQIQLRNQAPNKEQDRQRRNEKPRDEHGLADADQENEEDEQPVIAGDAQHDGFHPARDRVKQIHSAVSPKAVADLARCRGQPMMNAFLVNMRRAAILWNVAPGR